MAKNKKSVEFIDEEMAQLMQKMNELRVARKEAVAAARAVIGEAAHVCLKDVPVVKEEAYAFFKNVQKLIDAHSGEFKAMFKQNKQERQPVQSKDVADEEPDDGEIPMSAPTEETYPAG